MMDRDVEKYADVDLGRASPSAHGAQCGTIANSSSTTLPEAAELMPAILTVPSPPEVPVDDNTETTGIVVDRPSEEILSHNVQPEGLGRPRPKHHHDSENSYHEGPGKQVDPLPRSEDGQEQISPEERRMAKAVASEVMGLPSLQHLAAQLGQTSEGMAQKARSAPIGTGGSDDAPRVGQQHHEPTSPQQGYDDDTRSEETGSPDGATAERPVEMARVIPIRDVESFLHQEFGTLIREIYMKDVLYLEKGHVVVDIGSLQRLSLELLRRNIANFAFKLVLNETMEPSSLQYELADAINSYGKQPGQHGDPKRLSGIAQADSKYTY